MKLLRENGLCLGGAACAGFAVAVMFVVVTPFRIALISESLRTSLPRLLRERLSS